MIINKLYIEGFKIIAKPLEIEFPNKGIIAIFGMNETGKSTLLESIEFALYGLKKGQNITREDIISWGKEKAKVSMEFTVGDQRYLLQREISIKGTHKVELVPIINGTKDRNNSIKNITEVESKIEELTGLDRESFLKLIYIKQKDLDALKELKAKREQLLNKVMGIEIFDEAIKNIKHDKSLLEGELDKKRQEMENVKRNKQKFEENFNEKQKLEGENKIISAKLKNIKDDLNMAKEELDAYEWLFKFNSIKNLIDAKYNQLKELEKKQKDIRNKQSELSNYNKVIERYENDIKQLNEVHKRYEKIETNIKELNEEIATLKEKRDKVTQDKEFSYREKQLLLKDLSREKQKQIRSFVIFMVIGLTFIIAGAILNLIILLVGTSLIIISIRFIKKYYAMDKIFTFSIDVQSLSKQIAEKEEQMQKFIKELEKLKLQNGFLSSNDINTKLSIIKEEIKKETGQENIENVKVIAEKLDNEIKELLNEDPQTKIDIIKNEIKEKEHEIELLFKTQPKIAESLVYNEVNHKEIKQKYSELLNEYNHINNELNKNIAIINKIISDMNYLRSDYERYPELEKELIFYEEKIKILQHVSIEIQETSKELRNKVIPHARLLINKILPLLTSERYSDFEITEDLKFKVYSLQAGGYKEREIFSGGTQDQFLIALRLAFTQSILNSRTSDDMYCFLMDESISSSDHIRKQGIFEVLNAMKSSFPQIFVIAHEDISDFVDYYMVLERDANGYTELKSKSW